MGLLQPVNYTHNNLWRNDGPLYFAGVTFGREFNGSEWFGCNEPDRVRRVNYQTTPMAYKEIIVMGQS